MLNLKLDNVRVIRAAIPVCRRMTERGKILNPDYSIFRDQPTPRASPLRVNTLLYGGFHRFSLASLQKELQRPFDVPQPDAISHPSVHTAAKQYPSEEI